MTFIPALGIGCSGEGERCRRLSAIAQDPQKMEYVRDWAKSRLADPDFTRRIKRNNGNFGGPFESQYIDMDWAYLRFKPELSRVEFNINTDDLNDIEAKKISSITVAEGRTRIIISLNGDPGLGLEDPEYIKSAVKSVGNNVFLDCNSVWRGD